MHTVPSICAYCGVGCGVGLRVENGRVVGVEPQAGHPVSQGQLCAKGWSNAYAVDPVGRITTPLVREHGELRPASWDEALARVAAGFAEALAAGGGLAAERLLGDEAVRADGAGVDLVGHEVVQLHHVHDADHDLLVHRLAGAAVVEEGLAGFGQAGLAMRLTGALEPASRKAATACCNWSA